MNKFDEICIFRIADVEDVDGLMLFIKQYWSKRHILANDKEFFMYEFKYHEKINFLIAQNKKTNEIEAIMGFYPYAKEMIPEQSFFSGGILRVNPNSKIPMLGMEMVRRLFGILKQKAYIGNGANPVTALPLELKVLKHTGGRLNHFYILASKQEYKIAKIKNKRYISEFGENQRELVHYTNAEEMYRVFDDKTFQKRIPYKDRWYIEKRYFNHPIYQYQLMGIGEETVIVCREIECNSAKVLRIVDILGDVEGIQYVGKALQKLIRENNYEYIDLYEHGVSNEALRKAGFVEREENDENIIPNYFEPYECRNIEVYYHSDSKEAVIFKADGDQDRPNHR